MNKSELSIASNPNQISMVENFIEKTIEEFHLSENLRGKVTLSVIEAVNNAILHGNGNDPQKLVKIKAIKGIKRVVIIVEDEGGGFDFTQIPDPTLPGNLTKTGGRGLYLMNLLTDRLLFARNGAKVVMTFLLD